MHKIYLSEQANPLLKEYLIAKGHRIVTVASTPLVYEAVSHHPDIYMCKLGVLPNEPLVVSPALSHGEAEAGADDPTLGFSYPKSISYNAVGIGPFFIHNLKHTAPELLAAAKAAGMELVDVKQGYVKCNMVVVDEGSAITSDLGIAKALADKLDILVVTPGHVALSGFPYGFLGGASGRVTTVDHQGGTAQVELLFNGDLSAHPDFFKIRHFIESKGTGIKYFPEYELTDIGSIIETLD